MHITVALARNAALVIAFTACGGAGEGNAPRAPEPIEASSRSGWSKFHSKRFQLTVALPQGRSWKVDDHSQKTLNAKSESLRAQVKAIAFFESANQNRAMCLERARSFGWVNGATEPFVERTEVHPSDYDGEWNVVVRREGDVLVGIITWVGAKFRRCVALEYTAQRAAHEERELGEHLGEVRAGLERYLVLDPERTR